MQYFLDAITIPVGMIGLYAWWVFSRDWTRNHRLKIEKAESDLLKFNHQKSEADDV